MAETPDIVLWHYHSSPYAKKVVWYLALRGIPYAECIQPPVLPRPDLAALGVNYRRIPVLSIGRDFYLDTRLILRKLEELYPTATSSYGARLGSDDPTDRFVEDLVRSYMMDTKVFQWTAGLVPLKVLGNPVFEKDRAGFLGKSWKKEDMARERGECLRHISNVFGFLEGTIFKDGREWILKGKGPSLVDIEAIWPLEWLETLPGALPSDVVSSSQYPKVFAWMARFRAAIESATSLAAKPVTLEGPQAAEHILKADFAEAESFDTTDMQGFHHGVELEMQPTDWETGHRDRGALVSVRPDEVAIAAKSKGGKEIRIHAPRIGFRFTEVDRSTKL